ncbi:hypothetical protein [Altererythrobacter sp. MF3-039]|uniref:hypothetical protein n=1 Tax=Altererythrobacter sp. MF3-039 TaxID=3252901 RepID=UPI00390C9A07
MTLGVIVPAGLAVMALFELLIFGRMRRRVPGRTEQHYQQVKGEQQRRAFSLVMFASVLTPILAWIILNLLAPEIGAIEIF